MTQFPRRLYTAAEIRSVEARACAELNFDERGLMEAAGGAAYAYLRERWPRTHRLVVVCGIGNNGGDGYVLARHAHVAGLDVKVLEVDHEHQRARAAADARQAFIDAGGKHAPFLAASLDRCELIVDAVFGIGLTRPPAGAFAEAISAMDLAPHPVLALDTPSGLDADTGHTPGVALRAAATVCFLGLKRGLFTHRGPDLAGAVELRTLDVPAETLIGASALTLSEFEVRAALAERVRDTHKGDFGSVLVVGGDRGFGGAGRDAHRAEHATAILARLPEAMVVGVEDANDLVPWLASADVIAVGPGLGTHKWGKGLLGACLDVGKPLVVDADALNLLALSPRKLNDAVLTPHPGEAARLLGTDAAAVQRDRFAAVSALRDRCGEVVVLKGAGTLVFDGDRIGVCDRGNPGMASAGVGDVLTGVIAGLRAQGLDAASAARVGVWVHAAAGDAAAEDGERGLIASDLFKPIRALLG
jgi:NAD(P)H-hydrate epimerase